MKYIFPLIIVLFVILAVWFFVRGGDFDPSEVTNYSSSGDTIIAFGDSLIEGVGSEQGGGFVSVLERDLGVTITNLGVSGNTTAQGLARIDDALELQPEVVLLLLGGNDFIKRVRRAETEANLDALITQFHNAGSAVILLGVKGGLVGDGYKEMYEDLAKRHGTAFVPNVLDGLLGRPELMFDAIHPNDMGYARIADRILPILSALLS